MKKIPSFIFGFYCLLSVSCSPESKSDTKEFSKEEVQVFIHVPGSYLNYADLKENQRFVVSKRSLPYIQPRFHGQNIEDKVCFDDSYEKDEFKKSYENVDSCLKKFSETVKIDRIIVGPSETLVMMGGHFRTKYSVQGLQKDYVERFVDKSVMKQYLITHDPGILTSRQLFIGTKEAGFSDEEMRSYVSSKFDPSVLKFILKPTSDAGSSGIVVFENNPSFYPKLLEHIRSIKNKNEGEISLVLEEFMEGKVLRMDGYINSQKMINLTSEYYVTPREFYQHGKPTKYTLVSDPHLREKYNEFTARVIKALDYKEGIFHLEAIEAHDGRLYFLEIAIRVGGNNVNGLIALGYSPRKAYIYSQLGKELDFVIDESLHLDVISIFTPLVLAESDAIFYKINEFQVDLDYLETYQENLSLLEQEGAKMRADERNLAELYFVSTDKKKLDQEVERVMNSLHVSLESRGGKYDGHIFKLDRHGWVLH